MMLFILGPLIGVKYLLQIRLEGVKISRSRKMVRMIKKSIINLIIAIYITILVYLFMQYLSSIAMPISAISLYNWLFLVMSVAFLHFVAYVIILIVKVVSDLKVEKVKASMEK